MLNPTQVIIAIIAMAIITFLTRVFPFALFGRGQSPPKYILYLGKVLPPAIIAMLIVYCLKNVSFLSMPFGIPEIVSIALVAVLHAWKKNSMLSILGGTVVYMLFVQVIMPV